MKLFSINKKESSVLITFLIVIFLAAGYFFIYIPANEKRVQEQRFRSMKNVSNNIHARLNNSVSLLNNSLTAYKNNDDKGKVYLEKYIKSYPKDNFILSPLQKKRIVQGPLRDSLLKLDSTYNIDVNNLSKSIDIDFRKVIIRPNDTALYNISIRFGFQQFIQTLLPKDVFNEYLVFSNEEIVHETFPSGIVKIKFDSIIVSNAGIAGSGIKNITLGGKEYKMFLQPINFTNNKTWVIAGLLSNNRYQVEKNQLPGRIVLFLVTFVLIIIVAFPWIKLYQMGNKERLTIADGAAIISVSMLLMSLMSFAFFRYSPHFLSNDAKTSKDVLADKIVKAFENEIDGVYKKLAKIDSLKFGDSILRRGEDVINLTKPNISFRESSSTGSLLEVNKILKGTSVRQMFWLAENGIELTNWINDSMNAPHGNYKNRDYLQRILNEDGYQLPGEPTRFYLDQVVSWSSGKFTSVISKPSIDTIGGSKVAVMSLNIKSVKQPILPLGYKYALINKDGTVLYHSDESRNLNEDLLNEFSDSSLLTACIEGRSSGVFKTKYFSNEYNVKVKPLRNLPYFIVVFGETEHKETRDIEIFSFTLSMMLIFFAFLILQLLAIFLVSSKRSFFKNQLFNTNWIGPKISSHHQYNLAIIFNCAIIILLVVFFNLVSFLTFLFILIFTVTIVSVFLNCVFLQRYKKENDEEGFRFKRVTLIWLATLIIATNIATFFNLEWRNVLVFLLYEGLVVVLIFYFLKKGDGVTKFIGKLAGTYVQNKWRYTRSFTLMGISRLIITSAIPIMFFYISSYNYEQNISIRYNHLKYANNLIEKIPPDTLSSIAKNQLINFAYTDGEWINNIDTTSTLPPLHYNNEDKIATQILGMFRLFITSKAVRENNFYYPSSGDSSIFYNHLLQDACNNMGSTVTYVKTNTPNQYLKLVSSGLNYNLPSLLRAKGFANAIFYWGLLVLLLTIFYFSIYNILHKLFALNIPELDIWKTLDDKILTHKTLNSLLFIIGLPGSGKASMILKKINDGTIVGNDGKPYKYDKNAADTNDVFILDLINIPDSVEDKEGDAEWKQYLTNLFKDQHRLIIVNHFEYNIQDAVTNRIKLNLLEKLMQQNKCKIIVLSTIHPVAFLDSILDPANKPDDKSVPGQDLERWHVLLGHYRIIVVPIENSLASEPKEIWKQYIYGETRSSHFLLRLQNIALEVAETIPENERLGKMDELAFKLQLTAHYFYMYIWQSLTKEEKFLLYDLAEDNLVNSFDSHNLTMLISKGIIIKQDGALKLFNRGFRNFILTAIGNTEAMKIKNHIKDTGNWSRLKNPLIIVILAICGFLLASQEESYAKVITYITALGAGIPTIIKLLSVFDKDPAKSS